MRQKRNNIQRYVKWKLLVSVVEEDYELDYELHYLSNYTKLAQLDRRQLPLQQQILMSGLHFLYLTNNLR